jgi:hypothetical protein
MFGGSQQQWQGLGMFFPEGDGVELVKRVASDQLRELMQRTS